MIRLVRGMAAVLSAGIATALMACGSSGGSSGDGGAGGSTSASNSYHCCLNEDAYACPNKAAFDKCAGGDPQSCFDKCGVMDPPCLDECMSMLGNNDPSDCTKVSQPVSSYCSSTGSGTPSGGCHGQSCSSDHDCPDGQNCDDATGACFEVDADCTGNDCSSDHDCPNGQSCNDSNHTCFSN